MREGCLRAYSQADGQGAMEARGVYETSLQADKMTTTEITLSAPEWLELFGILG